MNSWGLKETDIQLFQKTFAQFPEVSEVRIFGSRALGNFKPGSDVDLALFGKGKLACVTRISAILNEELPLPYRFDVVDYAQISRPDFIEHIDSVGQKIYGQLKK